MEDKSSSCDRSQEPSSPLPRERSRSKSPSVERFPQERFAQGQNPQGRIPQERKRRGNCFQCGRPGHWNAGNGRGAGHTRNVCPSKGFKSNKVKEKKEKNIYYKLKNNF